MKLCAENGQWQKAVSILQQAQAQGSVSAATIKAVFTTLLKEGQPATAISLLKACLFIFQPPSVGGTWTHLVQCLTDSRVSCVHIVCRAQLWQLGAPDQDLLPGYKIIEDVIMCRRWMRGGQSMGLRCGASGATWWREHARVEACWTRACSCWITCTSCSCPSPGTR